MRGSGSGVRPASGPVPGTQPMFHTHTLHTAMSSQRGLWPRKSGDSGGKEAGGRRADKNMQGREQRVSCWRGGTGAGARQQAVTVWFCRRREGSRGGCSRAREDAGERLDWGRQG